MGMNSYKKSEKCIRIKQGELLGLEGEYTVNYLGIPYAEPPVGDLRFREPKDSESWKGIYDAVYFRKDPMQANASYGPENYSEDCLYLNVWRPKDATGKIPVIVWIPGGAYATGGSGAKVPEGPALYDCEVLARDTECIIVSISYRLNAFGFLNLSYLSDRFEDNLGLKDIIMALKWVKENISCFGGDAHNITLMGQSAGAGAISTLMMIKEARPLFDKVIMQSNCLGSYYTPEEAKAVAEKFLELCGVSKDDPEELLNVPYEVMNKASQDIQQYTFGELFGKCAFSPVVDGSFIEDYPTLHDFRNWSVPVLIGSNRMEGNYLVKAYKVDKTNIPRYSQAFVSNLPDEEGEWLLSRYDLPDQQAMADLLTEGMYAFPKLRMTEHMMKHSDVFVYRYDYEAPVLKLAGMRSGHIAELLPLFDVKAKPYATFMMFAKKQKAAIGLRMRRYWGSFARYGRPDYPGQIRWEPYDEEHRYTLLIGRKDRLSEDAEKDIRLRYKSIEKLLLK